MDGSQSVVQLLDPGELPSLNLPSVDTRASLVPTVCHPWTLDFGIPAEMTGLQHLCITESAERGNDTNQVSLSSNTIPVYSITLQSICQPGHCHITHYSRFYVASLRRCVKPSFAFLAMRHAIQWAKIFLSHTTAQRRNVKSKAKSTWTGLQIPSGCVWLITLPSRSYSPSSPCRGFRRPTVPIPR